MAKWTKLDFAQAYLRLTSKKESTNFTVEQLAKEAGYSRTAFYDNFSGMDDVLVYLHEEIHKKIFDDITALDPSTTPIEKFADIILPVAYEHRDELKIVYRYTLNATWIHFVVEKYWPWMKPHFKERFERSKNIDEPKLLFLLYIKLVLAIISNWVSSDIPVSPKDMKKHFVYLMTHSLSEIIDLKF